MQKEIEITVSPNQIHDTDILIALGAEQLKVEHSRIQGHHVRKQARYIDSVPDAIARWAMRQTHPAEIIR